MEQCSETTYKADAKGICIPLPRNCTQPSPPEMYVLVSAVSYSLSLSSSKMSTSTLAFPTRSGERLIRFFASVMVNLSPLLHSIGSSKMAAVKTDIRWVERGKQRLNVTKNKRLPLCSFYVPFFFFALPCVHLENFSLGEFLSCILANQHTQAAFRHYNKLLLVLNGVCWTNVADNHNKPQLVHKSQFV